MIYVLLFLCCAKSVYGFCSYPCNWQDNVWFNAEKGEFSTSNAYTVTVGGEAVNCYIREGPFMITKRGNDRYRCAKITNINEKVFVIIETEIEQLESPPSLCTLCTPEKLTSGPVVWIVLGCGVPTNCPPKQDTDKPCTGCERNQPDDGRCCQKNKCYNMYSGQNRDRRNYFYHHKRG